MDTSELERLFSLEGRVALVTGAGQAAGSAIAIALASAGAHILAVDVGDTSDSTAKLIAEKGLADIAVFKKGNAFDRADLAALKSRLESAEKNFQQKLGEVDKQLQAAAKEWDAALAGTVEARKPIMASLNELLNRRSYIRNLVTNVQKELS